MMGLVQPHDLLWGMCPEILPKNVPQWVIEAVSEQRPVVVRRAVMQINMVAIGIRGNQRSQRFATQFPFHRITRRVQPESLIDHNLDCFPHLKPKLQRIHHLMQSFDLPWGYTGSVGYELATGRGTVTENSDIDLLIRTMKPISKLEAQAMVQELDELGLQLDVQLQTPLGGVALKEWARTTGKVLLKRNDCAVLVDNPWH